MESDQLDVTPRLAGQHDVAPRPAGQYKVRLENFYGPLDLLLHLIRENEVDIYNIPIAVVAQQYIGFLELMKKLDINLASEFLVMASTLLEIKARLLLPKLELAEEEELDPRLELVKRLLEYKHFKELAQRLAQLAGLQAKRFSRPSLKRVEVPPAPQPVEPEEESGAEEAVMAAAEQPASALDISLWDVFRAYEKITRATSVGLDFTSILYDDVPLEEIIEALYAKLQEMGVVKFSSAVGDMHDKAKVMGHFLAALELARQKRICIQQDSDFSDIELRLRQQ